MDTIYGYWDAQQIKYVLDAVAMLTSMSDYTGLMKVFAIFGLFVAVATTFVRARQLPRAEREPQRGRFRDDHQHL